MYSKAIELEPTTEHFLGRGMASKLYLKRLKPTDNVRNKLITQTFKDYADAISLAESIELEKEARLERLRFFDLVYVGYSDWEYDLEWLKTHTKGQEYAEIIYLEYRVVEDNGTHSPETLQEVITAINEVIELGYDAAQVYDLRARANFYLCNYGLAFQDIEEAIKNSEENEERVNRLCMRANIQAKMGKFKAAYETLTEAEQLSPRNFTDSWGYIPLNSTEILWRYSIAHRFDQNKITGLSQAIFQVILIRLLSEQTVFSIRDDNSIYVDRDVTGRIRIEQQYPEIVPVIRQIVGDEFWSQCENIARNGNLYWSTGDR